MPLKIVGALGSSGVPHWTDFFCGPECLQGRIDSEPLDEQDYQEIWVTPRCEVRCSTCNKPIFPEAKPRCSIS